MRKTPASAFEVAFLKLFLVIGIITSLTVRVEARVPPRAPLPISIEDSHAGTFFFLAGTLDLEQPHTLFLFDAHSDTTDILGSDHIRSSLRTVASRSSLSSLLSSLRSGNTIQAFNWIEPLMPRPIEDVVWIPAPHLPLSERIRLENKARKAIDGYQEFEHRTTGLLESHVHVTDIQMLRSDGFHFIPRRPAIVSIDLDFFADTPPDQLEKRFQEVTDAALRIPDIRALSLCLSSPWQRDTIILNRLAVLALRFSTGIENATTRFEPFAPTGKDVSLRETELRRKGIRPLRFDVLKAPPDLRTLILARQSRIKTSYSPEQWKQLLDTWNSSSFIPRVTFGRNFPDPDGVTRFHWSGTKLRGNGEGERFQAMVEGSIGASEIRWYALIPAHPRFNLLGDGFGFGEGAPCWIRRVPKLLAKGPMLHSKHLRSILDPETGAGTGIVYAELDRDGETWRTSEMRISVAAPGTKGYLAALSERFCLPYVFGAALLPPSSIGEPELSSGADCATFLIAGLRRIGRRIPYGDPRMFASFLDGSEPQCTRRFLDASAMPISMNSREIQEGLFLHLGRHITAIWKDLPPCGLLDPGDLVVHQLENVPRITTVRDVLRGRASFRIQRWKQDPNPIRLMFGGDVMMGRRVAETHKKDWRTPLEGVTRLFKKADAVFVNLESLLADEKTHSSLHSCFHQEYPHIGSPIPVNMDVASPWPLHLPNGAKFSGVPRQDLHAPKWTALWLKQAGVTGVSVANNHANEKGPIALSDSCRILNDAGIAVLGRSNHPYHLQIRGRSFFLFGYDASPGSANSEESRRELCERISLYASKGTIIVLVHWGKEHQMKPGEEQIDLSGRLSRAGACLVVGTGPHLVQQLSIEPSGATAFSLGNLVFDGPGPNLLWSRGAILDAWFRQDGSLEEIRLIPTRTEDNGDVMPILR